MVFLYQIILLLHVLSAILGMGPGFAMIYIVTKAKNMTELRHAYFIRNRLHIFVMIGGTLLLLSGLAMGIMRPYLFGSAWYVTSLILFLTALGFGPLVLSPKSRPIKELLKNHSGDDIPAEYYVLAKKLFFAERIENIIFLIIIALMILKPSQFFLFLFY
ncbi:hypothetical protein MASR2M18_13890 [Ignavibacteria bacterium]|nr:DUF2269 family protein [Bacteroidota bacterium]MCZ2132554.1 DUF2269 domain-containing protein [Bacteroidota bacterium]